MDSTWRASTLAVDCRRNATATEHRVPDLEHARLFISQFQVAHPGPAVNRPDCGRVYVCTNLSLYIKSRNGEPTRHILLFEHIHDPENRMG